MLSEAQLKVLIHRIDSRIPDKIKKYYDDKNHRLHIATKYGADKAFLDTNELKFVVLDPFNGNYRCDLIVLAVFKALWNCHRNTKKPKQYYINILNKAKSLYKEVGCQDDLEDKIALATKFNVDLLQ